MNIPCFIFHKWGSWTHDGNPTIEELFPTPFSPSTTSVVEQPVKRVCSWCGKEQRKTEFYKLGDELR